MQLGLQWKNVRSAAAAGEGALFGAVSHKFGRVQVNAGVAYKFQTGLKGPTDSAALELSAGITRKFGSLTARLSAIYSPNDLGSTGKSLFVEAGPAVELGKGWSISAGVGHRHREHAPDYSALSAGISKTIRQTQLDLRYYRTDQTALGGIYRGRIVASAKLRF